MPYHTAAGITTTLSVENPFGSANVENSRAPHVVDKKRGVCFPLYLVYSGGSNRMLYSAQNKPIVRNLQQTLTVGQSLRSAAFYRQPSTLTEKEWPEQG